MIKFALTTALFLVVLFAKAQEFSKNAYGEGLSDAMSCQTGIYALGYNPAGCGNEKFAAVVSYFDRYQVKEISQKSMGVILPALNGCFSADFNYYGFKLFNRILTGLGYQMQLSDKIKAGIKLNYHGLNVGNSEEKYHAVTSEIGFILSPLKHLELATYIKNPTNSQFSDLDTIIAVDFQTGIRYTFSEKNFAALDIEKSSLYDKISVKCAVSGSLNKYFDIQGGFSTFPFTVSAAAGLVFERLKIQTAVRRNEFLGYMPSVSLVFEM